MDDSTPKAWKLLTWDTYHSKQAGGRKQNSCSWFSHYTDYGTREFNRVKAHPRWTDIYTALELMRQVSSRLPNPWRGWLVAVRENQVKPLSAQDLADETGADRQMFELAFEVLSSEAIAWLGLRELTAVLATNENLPLLDPDPEQQGAEALPGAPGNSREFPGGGAPTDKPAPTGPTGQNLPVPVAGGGSCALALSDRTGPAPAAERQQKVQELVQEAGAALGRTSREGMLFLIKVEGICKKVLIQMDDQRASLKSIAQRISRCQRPTEALAEHLKRFAELIEWKLQGGDLKNPFAALQAWSNRYFENGQRPGPS